MIKIFKKRWRVVAIGNYDGRRNIIGTYWLAGSADARAERGNRWFRTMGWNDNYFGSTYVVERIDEASNSN